jgi:hypothetical protein
MGVDMVEDEWNGMHGIKDELFPAMRTGDWGSCSPTCHEGHVPPQ